MDNSELQSALDIARSVLRQSPYNAVDALHAVRQLVLLAPADVKPIAHAAEHAVVRTLSRDITSHDALALYALALLVAEMDDCEVVSETSDHAMHSEDVH